MKKLFLIVVLIIFSIILGYSFARDNVFENDKKSIGDIQKPKSPILRFALVADSENDNDLLAKALNQAKGAGVNFVIGLGDWSSVGTTGELTEVKKIFDASGLTYYMTAGDHDLWDSRNRGEEALTNYKQVFGEPSQEFIKNGIQFVILDNSDIYTGIKDAEISNFLFDSKLAQSEQFQISNESKLTFVFAHKTPFHPQSAHVMGEDSSEVADQAKKLMELMEAKKVDGFFCGDLHFFAQFNSPGGAVKMTTIGAVSAERNFQGPRFEVVTVYDDWTWEVGDVEIR